MALIVKKFGGTSVSTKERRRQVLEKIIREKDAGNDVVAVVSAMGRRGDPYATDTFLDMLKATSPRPAARTKDLLAACGETISACLVAEELRAAGCPAAPVTGLQAGILTDGNFTNGLVQAVDTAYLKAILAQGAVAVVTGFQGYDKNHDLVTLGRGGSDITAIALGGALGADDVEIYTDVPGIAFTDPRLIPSAPFLSSIDFSPMYILAAAGAKVIHPRAVSTAIKFNRPFWVRSTFNDDAGTLVGEKGEAPGGLYGIAMLNNMVMASQSEDENEALKAFACNEWFYRRQPRGPAVIAEPDRAEDLPGGCQVRPVGVVTLQWDPASGIAPELVAEALDAHGLIREGYFEVPGGGAWALAPHQAKEAVLALYRAPLQRAAEPR
jgi:aspartate kinase